MRIYNQQYHEPHNYPKGWGLAAIKQQGSDVLNLAKAAFVYLALTAVGVYLFCWGVDFGRKHPLDQPVKKVQHHKVIKGHHHARKKRYTV